MAAYTTYKNLEKPLSIERYDINVMNKNNDMIDSELHKLDLKNESQDNLLATKEALNSEIARATVKENVLEENLNAEIARAETSENELSNDIVNEINRAISAEDAIQENLLRHNNLISDLSTRINTLENSEDITLDQIQAIMPTKTSQLENDSITAESIGAATKEIVGAARSGITGETNIQYSYPANGMVSTMVGASDLNTALTDSTSKITAEVIKIEEKFESFEAAKSKIVSSAFGKKLGLTSESKMEDIATTIEEANAGILCWENTTNGTYKFAQSGSRWIANNRGINSSTATSTWTVTVPEATTAYIGYRVSSESGYDKITVILNDTTLVNAASGNQTQENVLTLNLVAGINTIVATYTKDSSGHKYGDMAYVVLPPIGEQSGQYKYQSKSVTPSTSSQTVYPDTGYDGLYAVTVSAAKSNDIYYSSDGNFKDVMNSLGTTPDMYTVSNFKGVAPSSIAGAVDVVGAIHGNFYNYKSSSNLEMTYDNTTGVVSGSYPVTTKTKTENSSTLKVKTVAADCTGYLFSPSGNW